MKQSIDFLDWAEEYVNQLDPLQRAARHPEFESEKSSHYRSNDEQLKAALARLLGAQWESAWKLDADYSSPPEQTPGKWVFSYREKSVFEISAANGSEDEFD